jgi:hypothetical protein
MLKVFSVKKVTFLKWKLPMFKNIIVAKKNFVTRSKSANNAIKELLISSKLSTEASVTAV